MNTIIEYIVNNEQPKLPTNFRLLSYSEKYNIIQNKLAHHEAKIIGILKNLEAIRAYEVLMEYNCDDVDQVALCNAEIARLKNTIPEKVLQYYEWRY